jgi:hypothetical protein
MTELNPRISGDPLLFCVSIALRRGVDHTLTTNQRIGTLYVQRMHELRDEYSLSRVAAKLGLQKKME